MRREGGWRPPNREPEPPTEASNCRVVAISIPKTTKRQRGPQSRPSGRRGGISMTKYYTSRAPECVPQAEQRCSRPRATEPRPQRRDLWQLTVTRRDDHVLEHCT